MLKWAGVVLSPVLFRKSSAKYSETLFQVNPDDIQSLVSWKLTFSLLVIVE